MCDANRLNFPVSVITLLLLITIGSERILYKVPMFFHKFIKFNKFSYRSVVCVMRVVKVSDILCQKLNNACLQFDKVYGANFYNDLLPT